MQNKIFLVYYLYGRQGGGRVKAVNCIVSIFLPYGLDEKPTHGGRAMFEEKKAYLIDRAINMYKIVLPCCDKFSLDECFTVWEDILIFWFNTNDNNTHVLLAQIGNMSTVRQECFSNNGSRATARERSTYADNTFLC
jgi:hypothetical protein